MVDQAELANLLELALAAAHGAADLVIDRPSSMVVTDKSTVTDVVTEMDHRSESFLVDFLLEHRGEDAILGEEGSTRSGTSGYRWIVDPIDGTVNYLYGLPSWSVCVGLEYLGEPVVGVVAAPEMGVTWCAMSGGGATAYRADGSKRDLQVGAVDDLSMALVATGFTYSTTSRAAQGKVVADLLPLVRDIRRLGSAAVDICLVASGKVDAYYEQHLNPWDFTAAAVIAREAGARVGGLSGPTPTSASVLVANQALYPQLASVLGSLIATGASN